MSPSGRVLGIFAKEPTPGRVKTRLGPPDFAARVAEAFLQDTLERCERIDARRVIVYAPAESEAYFARLAARRFELCPQTPGSLGARLARFIEGEIANETQQVVVIGTDSPTLPIAFIEQAFDRLDDCELVLGPATDGGYYLVGCARRLPPIFGGIDWSSSRVLAQTIERLSEPFWRLSVLPPWYDVDTADDWQMLRGHIKALERAGAPIDCPRTRRLAEK